MASKQDLTPRTSEVRDTTIPSVSVNSTITGQTPTAVTVKQAAPLPNVTTAGRGLTRGLERDILRSSNATAKRTRKSMSRRRGQKGHIEESGRWFVVRFWQDVAGQEKRALARVRICPISGAGKLSPSARIRRAKEIIQQSGADTHEHFERTVLSKTGITFRDQAEVWYGMLSSRKSKPVRPSTLLTWDGIVHHINERLGDLPLTALVDDQTPVRDFVQALHDDGKKPKTIRNYIQVVKSVVASAKDPKSRKQLFPIAWDNEYIDCPAVGDQRTPSVVAQQMSLIVERAEGQYRVMFALKAASGLRFGEILGLKIENVLDDCNRLCIIEKLWKSEQQDFLKTTNGKRYVELHSSIAALLRGHIGRRKSGYVFCTEDGKPLDQSNILDRVLHPILMGDENTPGIVVNINGKNFQGVKAGLIFSAVSVTRSFVRRTSRLACSGIGWGTAASRT